VVYPDTSSDSASAKSKGALFISKRNEITIRPDISENVKINQDISWIKTNAEKLKDSENIIKFKNIRPRNISILATNKQALTDARTEYLFLLKYPVSITQKLNIIDSRDA